MKKYEEVMMDCSMAAEEYGLNLDYDPAVMVEDISLLSTDEWVQLRRTGIGGSDAGTCMGVNSFATKTELVMDKLGKLPEAEVSMRTQYIFDYGHQMESCLGNYFAAFTGFNVYKDNRMFYHPLYPWMHANCDGFAVDGEGYKCLLEFKTGNPQAMAFWKSGTLGEDAVLYRAEYEYQVRHYMAILNIFRAYIVVGFDNNADNIRIIRVDRDVAKEVALINREADLWKNCVMKGIVPMESKYSDGSYKNIRPAIKADSKASRKELPDNLRCNLEELISLNTQKSELNARISSIEERINALKLPVETEMGEAIEGYLPISDREEYSVTFKATIREGITGEKLKQLKSNDPEIFDRYGTVSESRTLRVTVRKPKRR